MGQASVDPMVLLSNGKKKASALIAAAFSYTTASNGFFRFNIKDGSKTLMTIIPNTLVDHLDGIQFDDKNEFLFVAAYGTNSISAYYSCDDWKTTMLFRWDEYVCGIHELR
jgi:6-phosphogluconolactonase (cycloisomerase 2 family)